MTPVALEAPSKEADEFGDFIRGRRTVRGYRPKRPSIEVLTRLMSCAAAAPSAHNRQPWRYLVVRDLGTKVTLAEAMGKRLAQDRKADGDLVDTIEQDVHRSFERIVGAPVVVVVSVSMEDMDVYPDVRRAQAEFLMAVQSVAMATQNLMLAAHAEGLGCCWMCAPLFCPDTVKDALHLKPTWVPQGLVTLGYPATVGRRRKRLDLEQFVHFHDSGLRGLQPHD